LLEARPLAPVYPLAGLLRPFSRLPGLLGLGYGVALLPGEGRLLYPYSEEGELYRNVDHVYRYRDYERIADFIPRPGWRVVDAGAYLGVYALRAARLVGPSGLVVSLEPNPITYGFLSANVVLNRLGNVATLPAALSARSGWGRLHIGESMVNSSLSRGYVEYMSAPVGEAEVPLVTLGEIAGRLGHVDLVKLDVEGHELEALRGGLEGVERVVVEAHPPLVEAWEVASLLSEAGFDTLTVSGEAEHQAFVYGWRQHV